ncbi:immunoglobulin-like domain-containing protein [Allohahella sp. A8]|uniref:immunoglobulin-like domain-containing protein n=1 Tax=Allohahella sp. A8 TaxID=3141461 RepID=UPI003A7FA2B4
MPAVSNIGAANVVTQYQQAVDITITDGDANNLTTLLFAGFDVPFTVINSTTVRINAPGTVKEGYEQIGVLEGDFTEAVCTFNITHPIKVPAVDTLIDDNSILTGIGNTKGRYAKLTLPNSFALDGPAQIRAVEAIQNADEYISAKFGTALGTTEAATIDVLNNDGTTQAYTVDLVAGSSDPGSSPTLVVYGGSPATVSLGGTFTPSFSAVDETEGDISARVVVTGSVNTNVAGSYVLSYSITNIFSRTSTATQTVNVTQNVRYELRLLKSLDQDVRDVTGTYPTGYVFSENGNFGAIRLGPVSLVDGEVVITQDNVVTGSLASLFTGGTTLVGILLLDDANNVAATPTHIPITSVAI